MRCVLCSQEFYLIHFVKTSCWLVSQNNFEHQADSDKGLVFDEKVVQQYFGIEIENTLFLM